MFHDATYISIGIAPDAAGIVMQAVIPGDPGRSFAYTAALAELDSRGNADAIRKIGCLSLCSMQAFFPVINVFAESLIPKNGSMPLSFDTEGDRSGSKRTRHLRIHADNGSRSIVILRFDGERPTGHDTPALLLEPLMARGPEAVVDCVGTALLEQLTVLHPDVFAPFPALIKPHNFGRT